MNKVNTSYDTACAGMITPPGCIITFTGRIVNLLNPDPDTIVLEDIAHGLGHTCRWNGHTKTFYSVAEHSVRVAGQLEGWRILSGLFHDAEESYWGDIVRPLKALMGVELITKIVEFRQVIFKKFGVPDIDDAVNAVDDAEIQWDVKNVVESANHVGWNPLLASAKWLAAANKILLPRKYNNL